MNDLLVWLYLVNAVLLIDHEIDSAYWKEWDLFRLPGGIGGFLYLHLPLLLFILGGLVLVSRNAFIGLIFSLIVGLGGLFAFSIHTYFLKKGRKEFDSFPSKAILAALLVVSIAQVVVTLFRLIA